MSANDRAIDWLRKRIYIPPILYGGWITPAESGQAEGLFLSGPTDPTDDFLREVNTFGFVGNKLTAINKIHNAHIRIPSDLDPNYEIGFRINWTESGAFSSSVTWDLETAIIGINVTYSTTPVNLDTVIGISEHANTAWLNVWSSRGIRDVNKDLTKALVEDGAVMVFDLAYSAESNSTNVTVLGLEMDYVSQECVGRGGMQNRELTV